MKDFYISLNRVQRKRIQLQVDAFQKEHNRNCFGWGCIANISVHTGDVHVVLLKSKEMNVFVKAYEKAKNIK